MEEVEDDLETMRTMLIALQASKSPPVQKTFVDSAGLWNIQRWMKHARKDPTNPLCLQVLEKVILVLRELPLTIKHLQGSSLGITVSKLAADTNVSLNIRSKATLLKEQWMEMIENNSSKVPRLETEDSQSDNPRKKTRMDDASRLSQEPNHLNDAKNQSFLRGDYQDTYMDEDSNQFEAAKVHLQKAILKRKDPHQKTKKSVRFKAGDDLVQVKEFEKDPAYHEDECDDKRHEDEDERERRARDERYDDRHGSGYNDQLSADFERWSLRQYNPNKSEFVMSNSVTRGLVAGNYWRSPMVLTGLPELKKTGQESHEIGIQGYREATVPPVEYHLMDHIPPSPAEPDAETTPLGPPTRKIALWTVSLDNLYLYAVYADPLFSI
ncbi:hypothetical protein BGZ59_001516 [Podila verticillata]|nr:hypothetical protein BGZ59_001516 [Podila verticillata]